MDAQQPSTETVAVLREVLRSCTCPAIGFTASGIQTFVNGAFAELVGWSEAELVGVGPPYRYLSPDDHLSLPQLFKVSQPGHLPKEGVRLTLHHSHGEPILVSAHPIPLRGNNGEILEWFVLVQALSKLPEADHPLRKQHHFITQVTQATPDIIYVFDLVRQSLVYINRRIEELLGHQPAELKDLGANLLPAILHPDDVARLPGLFARWETAQDGEILESEHRLRAEDGSYRWVWVRELVFSRNADGQVVQLLGAAQDITERKNAELAREIAEADLRESEGRYRLLADYSTDLITRETVDGRFLYLSPASVRLLGYLPTELVDSSKYRLIHTTERDRVFEFNRTMLRTRAPSTATCRVRKKSGEYVWCEVRARAISASDEGEPQEVLSVWRDVSDRAAAEESLRQSEARFRAIVERSHDGIVMLDHTGAPRFCSPTATTILGYSLEHPPPPMPRDWINAEDWLTIQHALRRELAKPGGTFQGRIGVRRRDLTYRHLDVAVVNSLGDPTLHSYIVTFRDVTDRVELESQLQQIQRMEAIGRLAGGIAHDFNNLLTAIMGNVHALLTSLTPSDELVRPKLLAIDQAARRGGDLTQRLLGYSRRQILHRRATNLGTVVQDTLVLLRASLDPRITFHVSIAPEVPLVWADPDQCAHIITNLCLNARDAMPNGGILKIAVELATIDQGYTDNHVDARTGEFVRLSVEDTGIGMPPEVLGRIFEPFFTTKPTGGGTGLGLAMVYGIVKSHEGWITCKSEVGHGTRMELFFPQSLTPVAEVPPTPLPTAPENAKAITLLLVDDEAVLRTLGQTVLQQYGYKVLTAEDGLVAVRECEQADREIHLVILDMTMPHLSGIDTFHRIRGMRPQLPVLFCSGFAEGEISNLGPRTRFLPKPYRPSQLVEAVRNLLAET